MTKNWETFSTKQWVEFLINKNMNQNKFTVRVQNLSKLRTSDDHNASFYRQANRIRTTSTKSEGVWHPLLRHTPSVYCIRLEALSSSWNYLPTVPYFQVSTPKDVEIDNKSCIDPDLCVGYINKGLTNELLSILRHKFYAQYFGQGHNLHGYCAKPASNLHAKVGLFILPDPRKHKVFFQFS